VSTSIMWSCVFRILWQGIGNLYGFDERGEIRMFEELDIIPPYNTLNCGHSGIQGVGALKGR